MQRELWAITCPHTRKTPPTCTNMHAHKCMQMHIYTNACRCTSTQTPHAHPHKHRMHIYTNTACVHRPTSACIDLHAHAPPGPLPAP